MTKSKELNKRTARVTENKGFSTWRIEELWPGGTIRSPFGSADQAVAREQDIAEAYGFEVTIVLEAY